MTKACEWEARVARWRASGLTSKEFSGLHGYSASSLLWWSSQLRRKRVGRASKPVEVRLARVIRAPNAQSPTPSVLVEFEGARVAVSDVANAETLRAVFEALRGRTAP